jgi:hypothetical protein
MQGRVVHSAPEVAAARFGTETCAALDRGRKAVEVRSIGSDEVPAVGATAIRGPMLGGSRSRISTLGGQI